MMRIEVIYATPEEQELRVVQLAEGQTIKAAILASQVLDDFPEIDLETAVVGVFSQRKQLTDVLVDGDRVEIYRPLMADPKANRRAKADRQKERKEFL